MFNFLKRILKKRLSNCNICNKESKKIIRCINCNKKNICKTCNKQSDFCKNCFNKIDEYYNEKININTYILNCII
jgi:hypothetical protein